MSSADSTNYKNNIALFQDMKKPHFVDKNGFMNAEAWFDESQYSDYNV